MKNSKIIVACVLAALLVSNIGNVTLVSAASNKENNFRKVSVEYLLHKENNSLKKLKHKQVESFSLDVCEATDGNVSLMAATRKVSNRFSWSYSTIPLDTANLAWSTNKDVYLEEPYDETDPYLAATTSLFSNPTHVSAYTNSIKEGYVNDSYGTQVGPHIYVHNVSNSSYNHYTSILDTGVAYQIIEKETSTLVFDSGDYRGDEVADPNYVLSGNVASVYVVDGTKRVCDLELANGSYYFLYYERDNYSGNSTHYAFFTGKPIPVSATYSAGIAHQGSVKWNGIAGGMQTVQCPSITISANKDEDIFAIKRIAFRNVKPVGSSDYLYVDEVYYMYKSPNSSYYKTVNTLGTDKNGPYIDSTPGNGSIVGTYDFQYRVTWGKSLAYVGASFFTLTNMDVTYLAPIVY